MLTTHIGNLPLFSTVVPAIIFMFLSCRPFVAITKLSTCLVGVELMRNVLHHMTLWKQEFECGCKSLQNDPI